MKKLLVLLSLVMLVGTVMAAKPTSFDSNGVEKGWEKNSDGCATIQDGTIYSGRVGTPDIDLLSIGYDQFGYNYQAHMFNGRYCDYDRVLGGDYCDVELMMKWSDEWLANTNCNNDTKLDRGYSCDPVNAKNSGCPGAWLTNHERGSYLGNWDVTGDWVITVNNGAYPHDYTFTMTSLPDGTFTGIGGYPAGGNDYTYDEIVTSGQIIGDTISFTAIYYQNTIPTGYVWHATGTIDSNGELILGTGDAGVYEWHSTSGAATRETCEYEYFVKIVAAPEDAYVDGGMWYTADGELIGEVIWGAYAIIQQVENDPCAGLHGLQYNSPSPTGFGYYKP